MKAFIFFVSCVSLVSAKSLMPQFHVMRPIGLDDIEDFAPKVNERIVGGSEAIPHSHPYQVAVLGHLDKDRTALCGGSLIARNYILTAAHCIYDGKTTISNFTIVIGAHDINDESNLKLRSQTAIMHPAWNPKTLHNDIAVIRLPTNVEIDDKIKIIELPPYKSVGESFSDENAVISGWGIDADGNNVISPILRDVNVEVISKLSCSIKYPTIIQETMLCTSGAGGKGSCAGDSGSPVTALYKDKKVQIGVVSFGNRFGCENGWPHVHTRITRYLDWISCVTNVPIKP